MPATRSLSATDAQRFLEALWIHRGDFDAAYKAAAVTRKQVQSHRSKDAGFDERLIAITRAYDSGVQARMLAAFAVNPTNIIPACHAGGMDPGMLLSLIGYDAEFARRWRDVENGNYRVQEQVLDALSKSKLTARHLDCLEAVRQLHAVSIDSRASGQAICEAAFGIHSSNAKASLGELVRLGFLDSSGGRKGGYWITESGMRAVDRHRPKRS